MGTCGPVSHPSLTTGPPGSVVLVVDTEFALVAEDHNLVSGRNYVKAAHPALRDEFLQTDVALDVCGRPPNHATRVGPTGREKRSDSSMPVSSSVSKVVPTTRTTTAVPAEVAGPRRAV